MERTIAVPPGIGDCIWLIMKLLHIQEKFHWQIPASKPNRGHQVFELLPQVTASWKYDASINIRQVLLGNAQETYGNSWEKIKHSDHFFLSANKWLDEGNRIEEWLSDLPISYKLPWVTSNEDKELAGSLKTNKGQSIWERKTIGIYPSAYANNQNWQGWSEFHWFDFIQRMHNVDPDICYVMLGASYDLDLTEKLMDRLDEAGISYCNTIGMLLGTVVEILKRLYAHIGFPSGLSILNETLENTRTRMFYPENLRPMIGAWAEPARIADGRYMGMVFDSPKKAFNYFSQGIL